MMQNHKIQVRDWSMLAVDVTTAMEWQMPNMENDTKPEAANSKPGAAQSNGHTRIMHFAPRRWLAINSDPLPPFEGAIAVDVTGKWRGLQLTGTKVPRVLSASIQLRLILDGRDCVATPLFDCPAILLRCDAAYEIWVLASYQDSLVASLERTVTQLSTEK